MEHTDSHWPLETLEHEALELPVVGTRFYKASVTESSEFRSFRILSSTVTTKLIYRLYRHCQAFEASMWHKPTPKPKLSMVVWGQPTCRSYKLQWHGSVHFLFSISRNKWMYGETLPFQERNGILKRKGNCPDIMYHVSADGHKQAKLLPHRIDPWPSTVMQAMCKCSILFVKCFNNDVIRAIDNKAIKGKINIYLNVPMIAKSTILLVPDLEPRKWPLATINALRMTHDASIACHGRPISCLKAFLTTWHASEIAPIWAITLIAKLNAKQKDITIHGGSHWFFRTQFRWHWSYIYIYIHFRLCIFSLTVSPTALHWTNPQMMENPEKQIYRFLALSKLLRTFVWQVDATTFHLYASAFDIGRLVGFRWEFVCLKLFDLGRFNCVAIAVSIKELRGVVSS